MYKEFPVYPFSICELLVLHYLLKQPISLGFITVPPAFLKILYDYSPSIIYIFCISSISE